MIVLGLLLLIAAAVFGLDLIWKNHFTIHSLAVFGQSLGVHNAAELFILGAVTGAVLLLGIAMILAGLRRKGTKARRHRAERKEAKSARHDRDQVQAENDKLHRRLDHDDHDGTPREAEADADRSGATAVD